MALAAQPTLDICQSKASRMQTEGYRGRNQAVSSNGLPNSKGSPTRGVTTCTPWTLAAASVRSIGSAQAWYDRLKVA
jgi:hypothetical protein